MHLLMDFVQYSLVESEYQIHEFYTDISWKATFHIGTDRLQKDCWE